jgi:Flp pilus assembly protein TadG
LRKNTRKGKAEGLFSRAKRLLKNEKGQSLVETALVLPVLLLLFCGIVDFSWIMGNQLIAENGCREGARLGAVISSQADYGSQISTRVMAVTPGYSHAGISVSSTLSNPSNPSAGDITVKISYTFRLLTPMAQTILGEQDYTASAICIMKAE